MRSGAQAFNDAPAAQDASVVLSTHALSSRPVRVIHGARTTKLLVVLGFCFSNVIYYASHLKTLEAWGEQSGSTIDGPAARSSPAGGLSNRVA